jgi:hypothetical protein
MGLQAADHQHLLQGESQALAQPVGLASWLMAWR